MAHRRQHLFVLCLLADQAGSVMQNKQTAACISFRRTKRNIKEEQSRLVSCFDYRGSRYFGDSIDVRPPELYNNNIDILAQCPQNLQTNATRSRFFYLFIYTDFIIFYTTPGWSRGIKKILILIINWFVITAIVSHLTKFIGLPTIRELSISRGYRLAVLILHDHNSLGKNTSQGMGKNTGAVQLIRNALRVGRSGMVWHFVTGGGSGGRSTERYVTPKIIYMYHINYNFYCYVCLFIHIYTCIILNMWTYFLIVIV